MPLIDQGTFAPVPTRPPTSPTTPAPVNPATQPTVPPVDPDGGNIVIENVGTGNAWWHQIKVKNVAEGYFIHSVAISPSAEQMTTWSHCDLDMSAGYPVYQCEPATNQFMLPMSVKVTSVVGDVAHTRIGDETITTFQEGAKFDLGSNFGDLPPAPVTPPSPQPPVTPAPTNPPQPTLPPVTPAPTTPTPTFPFNGETIKLKTYGSPTGWYYAGELDSINDGYYVEIFEIKGTGGDWFFCPPSSDMVYQCQAAKEMTLPLSVRLTGSNGQPQTANGVIKDFKYGSVWDLGFNIGGNHPLNPTPPPTGPSTSSTSSSTSSTSTTPRPTTPAPLPDGVTASPTKEPTPGPTNEPKPPTAPTPEPTRRPGGADKEVIGYYASWQLYDRNALAKPSVLATSGMWDKVTIVNFAFFHPTPDGTLYGTDDESDPRVLFGLRNWNPYNNSETAPDYKCHRGKQYPVDGSKFCGHWFPGTGLIDLVHAAGHKIYPSLGGWTLSCNFPSIAADPVKRKHFAEECVALIDEYGFDGIDLDWEYPTYADHCGTPADTQNFNLMLQDLRAELDAYSAQNNKPYYEITAAVGCGPSTIAGYDIPTVSKYLDQINLMTYDFFGGWSSVSGANAPIYDQGFPAGFEDWNVDGCVNNWLNAGAYKEQLNIGLPFYGQSFLGATGPNQKHQGSDTTSWHEDDGKPQYYNIESKSDQLKVSRNDQTMTAEAHFKSKDSFVSFDDQHAICDKVEYAIDNDLNGFIIWELTGDLRDPSLETPLLDEVNMKLDYPATHVCGGSRAAEMDEETEEFTAEAVQEALAVLRGEAEE